MSCSALRAGREGSLSEEAGDSNPKCWSLFRVHGSGFRVQGSGLTRTSTQQLAVCGCESGCATAVVTPRARRDDSQRGLRVMMAMAMMKVLVLPMMTLTMPQRRCRSADAAAHA